MRGLSEFVICAVVEHAHARAEALPEYLEPGRQAWRDRNEKLSEVQDTKAREAEHVRYRAVAEYLADVEFQAVLQGVQGAACQELPMGDCGSKLDDLPWPLGFASDGPRDFLVLRISVLRGSRSSSAGKRTLKILGQSTPNCFWTFHTSAGRSSPQIGSRLRAVAAHGSALWVTNVQGANRTMNISRWSTPSCSPQTGLRPRSVFVVRLWALVKKHSGELVELDRRLSGWELRAVTPGLAIATLPLCALTLAIR